MDTDDLETLFQVNNWSEFDPLYPERPLNHHFPDFRQNSMRRMLTEVFGTATQPDISGLRNVTFYNDESELALAIAADVNGIGFVSFGSLVNMDETELKIIALDGSDHITDINYPVQRSLFLITDEQTLGEKPEVTAFISYYLNRAHLEMPPLGYAPLTLSASNQVRRQLVDTVQDLAFVVPDSQITLVNREEQP